MFTIYFSGLFYSPLFYFMKCRCEVEKIKKKGLIQQEYTTFASPYKKGY